MFECSLIFSQLCNLFPHRPGVLVQGRCVPGDGPRAAGGGGLAEGLPWGGEQ